MSRWSDLTRASLIILAVYLFTACVGPTSPNRNTNAGRYVLENDSSVLEPLDISSVKKVIPVAEIRTQTGNKSPYTVDGWTYRVMETEAGYSEVGMVSWYGRKFHGHLTSNGEVYDMFQLSAAHRSLPLPSYLQVTNLENGRSVIVRVNDRGPFHSERIADLSYAAASILGFAEAGTARVRVEAVVPQQNNPRLLQERPVVFASSTIEVALERQIIEEGGGQEYLQVGAFSNRDAAEILLSRLAQISSLPAFIHSDIATGSANLLHRVRIGPLNETMDLQHLINLIVDAELGSPFKVTR